MTPFPGTVTMEAMREADVKVLFQNQDIAVVDKPAGVAVHEGESVSRSQSLISTLEAHFRSRKENAFLVHRLDRETSGCLSLSRGETWWSHGRSSSGKGGSKRSTWL